MTALALFGDSNVVPALHVAVTSALASWPGPEPLEIHLFHRDLTAVDLAFQPDGKIVAAGTVADFSGGFKTDFKCVR